MALDTIKAKLTWRPDKPDWNDQQFSDELKRGNIDAGITVDNHESIPMASTAKKKSKNEPVFEDGGLGAAAEHPGIVVNPGTGISTGKYPKLTKNIHKCSQVVDQQTLGACTTNALVGGQLPTLHTDHEPFSRLFTYYWERYVEGTIDSDSGSEIRTGIQVLSKYGCPAERVCPYDITKFKEKPSDRAIKAATKALITKYVRCSNPEEIIQALAAGYVLSYGFMCYKSLDTAAVATTGFVPLPKKGEETIGGHAVVLVDYGTAGDYIDESQLKTLGVAPSLQVGLVRNSWGADWGLQRPGLGGYFITPLDYIMDRQLSDDFWAVIAQNN